MQIAGTTAIVTGAASGLGLATAELLASAGAKVAGLDIAVADAGMDDDGILRHPCDVTSETSVQAALAKSEAALGPARILVNCAGVMESRKILGRDGVMPLDHFRRLIDVHLIGTFNMIVNTSSIFGQEGQIGAVSYSAAKAGIAGMTLPLARELAREGIRVVAIAPGIFETPMVMSLREAAREQIVNAVAFPKRMGKPREYAQLVRHICENDMLNGAVIRIDAGART